MRLQTGTLFLLLSSLLSTWSATASAADPQKSPPKSSQQDRWDAAYRDGRRAPWDISRPATDLKQAWRTKIGGRVTAPVTDPGTDPDDQEADARVLATVLAVATGLVVECRAPPPGGLLVCSRKTNHCQ